MRSLSWITVRARHDDDAGSRSDEVLVLLEQLPHRIVERPMKKPPGAGRFRRSGTLIEPASGGIRRERERSLDEDGAHLCGERREFLDESEARSAHELRHDHIPPLAKVGSRHLHGESSRCEARLGGRARPVAEHRADDVDVESESEGSSGRPELGRGGLARRGRTVEQNQKRCVHRFTLHRFSSSGIRRRPDAATHPIAGIDPRARRSRPRGASPSPPPSALARM